MTQHTKCGCIHDDDYRYAVTCAAHMTQEQWTVHDERVRFAEIDAADKRKFRDDLFPDFISPDAWPLDTTHNATSDYDWLSRRGE